jgi:glycine cleavage system H protein
MNFPEDLLYSEEHEWVRVSGATATIGITDFAQGELGDIVFVDIPSLGKTLKAGEVFGTVEAVKTVSDLYMPVAGKVEAINPDLETSPELVNSDAYSKGWIIQISGVSEADLQLLMNTEAYQTHVGV